MYPGNLFVCEVERGERAGNQRHGAVANHPRDDVARRCVIPVPRQGPRQGRDDVIQGLEQRAIEIEQDYMGTANQHDRIVASPSAGDSPPLPARVIPSPWSVT